MSLKSLFQKMLAMLILGGALIFGTSGVFHEAAWVLPPLIGSVKVEIGGKRVSANTPKLRAVIGREDIAQLAYFTNLKNADFRGSECYEDIKVWAEKHPSVNVVYSVPLPNGKTVDSSVQELDLTWMYSEEVDSVLHVLDSLPSLERVYLGEVGGDRITIEDMRRIKKVLDEARDDVYYQFSTTIGGRKFDGDTESVDLRGAQPDSLQELAVVLSCMNNLKDVELGDETTNNFSWQDIGTLKDACKGVTFHYSFTLYGLPATLDSEKLDYRGIKIRDNGDLLYKALYCMNSCKYVDMDDTGVSYESLSKLQSQFPDTKIVWRVWFGDNYSVRTDTERILASKPTVGGMIADASVLKYCTEVKYLDLGHNDDLADLSFVANMPNLEVLIIAMTAITDISPLQNCPKLEYLELNSTNIADISALGKCVGLHHLNIAGCPNIKDITALYGLSELERLWIGCDTPVPASQVSEMKAKVPGCKINTTADDPHGDAWRFTAYDPEEPKYYWVPRYELLREQMGYNYQEYSFYWLDPYCDKEAPEEYRGMYGKQVYGLE